MKNNRKRDDNSRDNKKNCQTLFLEKFKPDKDERRGRRDSKTIVFSPNKTPEGKNFTQMTKLVKMDVLPDVPTTRSYAMINNNSLGNLIQLTIVITSLILPSIDAVIVYTRSMFISLRLSSELIPGYLFPETVLEANISFLLRKYRKIS